MSSLDYSRKFERDAELRKRLGLCLPKEITDEETLKTIMNSIASCGAIDEKKGGILPSFQRSLENFESSLPLMCEQEISQFTTPSGFNKFFFSPGSDSHSLATYLVEKGIVQKENYLQLSVPVHMMTDSRGLFDMFRQTYDISPFEKVENVDIVLDFVEENVPNSPWGESEDDY